MPPEEFYPREYTDTSRAVLERFLADFPSAVLIGGWASWRRIGALQSHDIDVIVGRELLGPIGERYGPVTASTHIAGGKWRADHDRVHFDIYVPYASRLGQKLRLRVEHLLPYAEDVDGWRLLTVPAHIATKLAALLDRPESEPGEKDRLEILGLLGLGVDPHQIAQVLLAAEASSSETSALAREAFELMQDLELDRTQRRRLREMASAIAEALLGIADTDL
jgi:hypothetical protein